MKTIDTEVKRVQIYRRGAQVIRAGQAELERGVNRILIRGLSQSADTDTMRILMPKGLSLSDIRYLNSETEKEDLAPSEKTAARIEELKKQIGIREYQAELWKKNGDFSRRNAQDLSDVESYIEGLGDRLSALNEEIRSLNEEIRELEKKLNEEVRTESLPVISAEITSESAGTFPLELRYHENSAYWDPVYELHTDAKSPLSLRVRARIFENTREDWKAAEVSLLTGNPSLGGELPELDPCFLNIRQERSSRARSVSYNSAALTGSMPKMAMAMEMEDTAAPEFYEAETEEAEVNTEETMTEYVLPGRRDIVSGADGTLADLQSFSVDAEYVLHAVPKKETYAYLAAKVKTKDLPPTVRGRMNVYLNGIYGGSINVSPDLTKEMFDISLGKEEAVLLSRIRKSDAISESRLKGQKYREQEFELRVTNRRDKEVTVTVRDQVPVSQDKSITVEITEKDGAELNEKIGILTWKTDLKAGETKVLHLKYRISWPRDKKISESFRQAGSICPSCGSVTVPGLAFCSECGYKLI